MFNIYIFIYYILNIIYIFIYYVLYIIYKLYHIYIIYIYIYYVLYIIYQNIHRNMRRLLDFNQVQFNTFPAD